VLFGGTAAGILQHVMPLHMCQHHPAHMSSLRKCQLDSPQLQRQASGAPARYHTHCSTPNCATTGCQATTPPPYKHDTVHALPAVVFTRERLPAVSCSSWDPFTTAQAPTKRGRELQRETETELRSGWPRGPCRELQSTPARRPLVPPITLSSSWQGEGGY
jgi:hypothetical protein